MEQRSLRSWRDFARECFCFGREAVNTSGQAVRGLVYVLQLQNHCLVLVNNPFSLQSHLGTCPTFIFV